MTSNIDSLNTQKKLSTYDVGNPGPDLVQAQKCGGIKPVNEIPTLPQIIFCCVT